MSVRESRWGDLISGSDLRGIAVGGSGRPVTLGDDAAAAAASCFARGLRRTLPVGRDPRIAVGHDSRLSAAHLKEAVIAGLADENAVILDCGLVTTPSMFTACARAETSADGAVMITASHLPWDRNGLKFITRAGGLSHDEVAAMVREMERIPPVNPSAPARVTSIAFIKIYAETLRGMIRSATGDPRPLAGLHVVVDAGCGAGGFFAREVLLPLGADIAGSIGLDPDGKFPLHEPNPEDPAAMAAVCAATVAVGAHLGLIFDADADRLGLCDGQGVPLGRSRLIALCSALVLRDCPGAAIVTDSVTSSGLTRFIASRGGRHVRYKRGYHNVIEEARRRHAAGEKVPLAIETSGHAAFGDNSFLDDGAYLAAWLLIREVILRREGRSLTDLLADWYDPVEEAEVRVALSDLAEADALIEALAVSPDGTPAADNVDGFRLMLSVDGVPGSAWVQARRSVHDPVVVINAESDRPGGLERVRSVLVASLVSLPDLQERVLSAWAYSPRPNPISRDATHDIHP